MSRKITIYSTLGRSKEELTTGVATWGELKPLLAEAGVSYNNMRVIVGETKNQLVNDQGNLPEGDFTLFMTPTKTKSGMQEKLGYLELRRIIQGLVQSNPSAAAHFNDGVNYTLKNSTELNNLLDKWNSSSTLTSSVNSEDPVELAKQARIALDKAITNIGEYTDLDEALDYVDSFLEGFNVNVDNLSTTESDPLAKQWEEISQGF